ncbi:MAG TPA: macrolide ABC transporter permease, partial [Erysipelotrichaceae bacterium]|nr:macrolide ABC transporter permease [Erysipelotrichaceae bacterium]
YQAQDLMEQAKQIQQLSQSTNTMLIWIAAISLLVGGIGVMNIMLVTVTERTREIGLKKAIGARKKTIMMQFLTEAVVLTSLGGLLGVLTGLILAKMISLLNGTPVAISIPASIFSVLFSMLIGIVFGLIPSWKAANLDPIEALRHE